MWMMGIVVGGGGGGGGGGKVGLPSCCIGEVCGGGSVFGVVFTRRSSSRRDRRRGRTNQVSPNNQSIHRPNQSIVQSINTS